LTYIEKISQPLRTQKIAGYCVPSKWQRRLSFRPSFCHFDYPCHFERSEKS